MDLFTLWLWPLIALCVLPAALVYFGLHVVGRGIIFVDLALAQIAALGISTAVLMGADAEHGTLPYVLAIAFTIAGAALFSLTRFRHPRVPHEAIIGIIYIVAAAAATMVLSHTASGDEEIKNLLVGNILLVSKGEVIRTALLYLGVGAFHYALRKKFYLISFDPEEAERQGMSVRLWDFLFYATFGLVVTSFVRIAGVYLVFSYLIVPAVCGALLSSRTAIRLTIGWVIALTAGLTGLVLSTQWESMDLPTGPTIVCTFGLLLVVSGAIAFAQSRRGTAEVARP
ncbi:MAG TPA: metal ABC transporter permease [Thermoanaerobaculia bacterium]|jgi:zinc/manganese transport system permease protein|nr:metal ABC transporter permease [Thermoanaerobaculia bacterium]